MLRILAASLVLATAPLSVSAPATAQTAQLRAANFQTRQEVRDAQTYDRAIKDFQSRGYAGLTRHLPALRAAFDRMPDDYAQVVVQHETSVARLSGGGDVLLMMVMLSAPDDTGKSRAAITLANVYGDIALLLASEAVEGRRYDEALAYLDRALKIQPANWLLLSEKIVALQGAQRWDEALALADEALDSDDILLTLHDDAFHRRRGFSLIELGRLDEAKAAYEAALAIDEDDANAKRELDYINKLQAGAPPTAINFVAPASTTPPQPLN